MESLEWCIVGSRGPDESVIRVGKVVKSFLKKPSLLNLSVSRAVNDFAAHVRLRIRV